jgi:amidase
MRRILLALLLLGGIVPASFAKAWYSETLPEIVAALEAGEVTSVQLVQQYLARIERLDRSGPTLNAVLSINPRALQEAKRLDELRALGQVLGDLHGVPILLKDNIESRDPLPTTAGSLALKDNQTGVDAPLVSGLRSLGAIVLGKANLSEWANFRSQSSMSGWSALGGQTRNPHMLDRNPCGSSSGSGSGVAASLTAAAVGTETNGSVICPASVNGIVGFKPTVGLVSSERIVPVAPTQDTAGPMTKSVMGAAMMLNAMDTVDVNYAKALPESSLQDVRIGVMRAFQGEDASIRPMFEKAMSTLEAAGAELVIITEINPLPSDFLAASFKVLLYEFKDSINRYLPNTTSATKSLADLIAFNQKTEREMALFDQSIFLLANDMAGLKSDGYKDARALTFKATREDGIDFYLREYEVDLLVAPSGSIAPRIDAINGDVWPGFAGIGWMAAIAGYPHATVPMGTVKELPMGLSFIASAGDDLKVLKAAFNYEQASQARVVPKFCASSSDLPSVAAGLRRLPLPHSDTKRTE